MQRQAAFSLSLALFPLFCAPLRCAQVTPDLFAASSLRTDKPSQRRRATSSTCRSTCRRTSTKSVTDPPLPLSTLFPLLLASLHRRTLCSPSHTLQTLYNSARFSLVTLSNCAEFFHTKSRALRLSKLSSSASFAIAQGRPLSRACNFNFEFGRETTSMRWKWSLRARIHVFEQTN